MLAESGGPEECTDLRVNCQGRSQENGASYPEQQSGSWVQTEQAH